MVGKKHAVFISTFVCFWTAVHAELTYMDTASSMPILIGPGRFAGNRAQQLGGSTGLLPFAIIQKDIAGVMHLLDVIHQPLVIGLDKAIAEPLSLRCHGSLEKVRKYNAWYSRQIGFNAVRQCKDGSETKVGVLSIVEPVVFLGADYMISRAAGSDVVKKGLECVPEHLRTFAAENGQFVLAAGVTRAMSAVAVEGRAGLNVDNAARFGKSMAIQVGAQGLGQYIINPAVETVVGSEESTTKTVASFAANYGALLAINYLINR